ncbi:MAG: glycosyltransferase family 4 protein, partial [Bdellovibrionales bacterium]|nr:glycosyltransferase family 4 protein [Bdellovibrionales bacterium]
ISLIARHFPMPQSRSDYGFLWMIAKGLARKGHRVVVLTSHPRTGGESEIQRDGVRVIQILPTGSSLISKREVRFSRLARLKFVELHRARPFHILHSVDDSGLDIARLKSELGIACAFDAKATQISQLFSIVGMAQESVGSLISTSLAVAYKYLTTYFGRDRRLLKLADGVFVTTPAERVVLERYYLYPDARIHTVPYGIEIGAMDLPMGGGEARKALGVQEESNIVVTVTDMIELNEIKNLLLAFEAAVIKKPDARLVLIGNGPMRKRIEFEVYSLALGNKVIFTGAIEESLISKWIAASDVFVNLSARASGFEPSLLEAMAQRKTVILSEVGVASSLIDDGQDGFLVRPADVPNISRLFIDIFTGHAATVDMGERARRKVTDLFDVNRMIDETVSAYFKILKGLKIKRKN